MTIKKRGRPVGSIKKGLDMRAQLLDQVQRNPSIIDDFAKTLKAWDEMEAQVMSSSVEMVFNRQAKELA